MTRPTCACGVSIAPRSKRCKKCSVIDPACLEYSRSPQCAANNRRTAQRYREQMFSWCPEDRHAEYQKLRKKVGAEQAKAAMLDLFAAEERARFNALSPFEQQMERVRNGGKLVAKFRPQASDHSFTLGGVSSGML